VACLIVVTRSAMHVTKPNECDQVILPSRFYLLFIAK
jgi:hypothetical protein